MEIKSNYIPHNFRNKYLKNVGGSYSSTVLQSTVSGEAGTKVVVIDDLETSSKDKALSANMGKYLNENKQDKNEYVDTINQYLSTDSDVKFNSVAGKNGEFDNLKVKGGLDVFTITSNEVRGTNGILYVTDSAQVTGITSNENNVMVLTVSDSVFRVDDILLSQTFDSSSKKIVLKVTTVDDGTTITCNVIEALGNIETGDALVRIANTSDAARQSSILLNPYDGCIDIRTGCKSESDSIVSSRIGNLDGITDTDFGKLSGDGLYSNNAYLSGAIRNLSGKWELKDDGSGKLANGNISWDTNGNLNLKFGTKKVFKKFDIDDYDFSNAFKIDLSDGLNFYFTKNKDNDPRTIILPSGKELEGYEVEMDFDGNPGLITVKCDSNYVIRYNGSYVNEIRIGHYPRRLKLVARKTYQLLSQRCEWWIDNAAEFKISSDGTFAGTFRSI